MKHASTAQLQASHLALDQINKEALPSNMNVHGLLALRNSVTEALSISTGPGQPPIRANNNS